ncbi:MAG: dUTP diphosphatase, partial [Bacilli bacterium]|nr:dUTP diphosphatase [Bacilli bacterium]
YEKKQVATYVKAYMQKEEHLQLHIRSSLALKRHLRLVNGVGIIDSDYYNNEDNEGHIFIALENCSDQTIIIEKGERFVQGIFLPYLVTDTDDVSRQRNGGLGSTGKK